MPELFQKLYNGDEIPLFGLGTWKSKSDGEAAKAVRVSLENGYRHIDCAAIYCNQKEIGEVFNDLFNVKKTVNRKDIWITSKLWNTDKKKENVRPALLQTLKDLQLEYLDLYLIHWPTAWVHNGDIEWPSWLDVSSQRLFPRSAPGQPIQTVDIPFEETWRELEKLQQEGLVRHIGLSNFSVEQTEQVLSFAKVQPSVNQIELQPYLPQKELREHGLKKNIHITAYSPLGTPDSQAPDTKALLDDPKLHEIAKKYNKQPANILIRYCLQIGVSVIPKSVTPERIISNKVESENFELSEEDVKVLDNIGHHHRFNEPSKPWGVKCFDDSVL